jgi:hypothetical protein
MLVMLCITAAAAQRIHFLHKILYTAKDKGLHFPLQKTGIKRCESKFQWSTCISLKKQGNQSNYTRTENINVM